MDIIKMLLKEFDQEAETTRKMLARVPDDKYNWQPHPKSMTMRRLATHIADIPSWVQMAIDDDELDFAITTHKEPEINKTSELLEFFEKSYKEGREALANAKEDQLGKRWVMRSGNDIYMESTKGDVVRVSISQIIHHRAQLGVYLRLLDISIPGSYGPSADEM